MSDAGVDLLARGGGGGGGDGGGPAYSPAGVFLSVSQFSEEAGLHRQTVAHRVRAAQLTPAAKRGAHMVYKLRDLLRAVYLSDDEGEKDVARMRPHERLAHLKAENIALALASKKGDLVPAFEVEQRQAALFKIVSEFMDTLPDVIERDCGAPPVLVARIERRLDEVRNEMYARIVNSSSEESAEHAPGSAGISP